MLFDSDCGRSAHFYRSAFVARVALALACLAFVACHADPDDPAGQAKELGDAVRRENAIANLTRLYSAALSKSNGDRTDAEVQAVVNASIDELSTTYVGHPEDTRNGYKILQLLGEMRDPRAMPALLKALDWRPEVTETHAVEAAKTIAQLSVPGGQTGEVVSALSQALDRVTNKRGVDNRMREAFIKALGSLEDRGAVPALLKVATRMSDSQSILFNRLAANQLGKLAGPPAVEPMIKALFVFFPGRPDQRMNDVAAQVLTQIGRPALKPLLATLAGKNEEANAVASQFAEAIKQRGGAPPSVASIVATEASYALGQLGFREALEPLLAEARAKDPSRQIAAAAALAQLATTNAVAPRIRESLQSVYKSADKAARAQVLAIMEHTFDAGLLPFVLTQARQPEDEMPQIRIVAVKTYAMLANRAEAKALRSLIASEPGPEDGGYKTNFQEFAVALDAADACNVDVSCWAGKLKDNENKLVAQKAAHMLARYGRGRNDVVAALVEAIDHPEVAVRADVLYAIDQVAVKGSGPAQERIASMREREQGRASWNQIRSLAEAVQARLRGRQS